MGTEAEVIITNADLSLVEAVRHLNLFACYQCDTCTGSCPVARFGKGFSPRRIIRLILWEEREELLRNPLIWLCTQCYLCYERCPQGVKPPEIIVELRNIAAKEGILPSTWPDIAGNILTFGLMSEVGEYENKIRQSRFDIPELPPPAAVTMRKLAEKISFDKLVHFKPPDKNHGEKK